MTDHGDTSADARVLVVGADADAAGFIADMLTRAGLPARASDVVRAASEVVNAYPGYAVVAIDHDLEAVRSIRALADPRRAAIPIVVLGADGAPASAAGDARDAGATAWIDRPISEADLVAGMRHMVETPD
jgi:DNA-binding response OmpR family regulator